MQVSTTMCNDYYINAKVRVERAFKREASGKRTSKTGQFIGIFAPNFCDHHSTSLTAFV